MINKIAYWLGWVMIGLAGVGLVLSLLLPTDRFDVMMAIGAAIAVAIMGVIVLLLNDISLSLAQIREQNKKIK